MITEIANQTIQTIHVAVGIIKNQHDGFLLTKRPEHKHQGGLWEFPGGKIEVNETAYQALVRELKEEIGIDVKQATSFMNFTHDYVDKSINLDVWKVLEFNGEPYGAEQQPFQWVGLSQMLQLAMPAGSLIIVQELLRQPTTT